MRLPRLPLSSRDKSVDPEAVPAYTVRSSARARRVQLRVLPQGIVEAVVPHGVGPRAVDAFVAQHRQWIAKRLARIDAQRQSRPHLFEDPPRRVHLTSLDRAWAVNYVWLDDAASGPARPGARERSGGVLEVRAADAEAARALLRRWLMRQAKEHLVPWLRQTAAELGLDVGGVSVRAQKSRWGSCSARGNISLNRNLLFLPPEGVRYLFVHELCHTVHMNHSRRFWALVARLDPHFERHEALLRGAHDYVPLWALPG